MKQIDNENFIFEYLTKYSEYLPKLMCLSDDIMMNCIEIDLIESIITENL